MSRRDTLWRIRWSSARWQADGRFKSRLFYREHAARAFALRMASRGYLVAIAKADAPITFTDVHSDWSWSR